MHPRAPLCVFAAAFLAAGYGCGGDSGGAGDNGNTGGSQAPGTGGEGGQGASGGEGGSGGSAFVPGDAPDRADISYANNILQKVADGEWTLGEGLVATLQVFAGEREADEVLRYPELLTYEITGVMMMSRRYVEDGPDPEARTDIARLLASLDFTIEELEEMAGIAPAATFASKQDIEVCNKFFEGFNKPPIGVGACLEVETVTIDGKEHRLFFPADPLPNAGWDEDDVAQTILALQDSIPVYSSIGDVPAINVVFSVKQKGNVDGQAFARGNGKCAISLYTGLQSKPTESFKQLVAHEIAHCLQGEVWSGQIAFSYETIDWHFEGSAEYLSNLVYPDVDLEHRYRESLEKAELFTSLQQRDYENFMFFQHLGNEVGTDGFIEFYEGLPTGGGLGAAPDNLTAQAEALGDYPDIARIFQEYTEAATDGAVRDSSGDLIPFTAVAREVDASAVRPLVIAEPSLEPFRTYRFLVDTEDQQADLEFREGGTLQTSARRATQGDATSAAGLVTESTVSPGVWRWGTILPTEVPEDECDGGVRMVVATTSKVPALNSSGTIEFATLEADVTDVDTAECCLHGTWVMNNEDLAFADTQGVGVPFNYSGSLSATYNPDGTVNFLWGPLIREIQGNSGITTSEISGSGTQFYAVPLRGLLAYSGPEMVLSVTESFTSGPPISFTAILDTALGDNQLSQLYECTDTALTTTIRGSDVIGWQRMGP